MHAEKHARTISLALAAFPSRRTSLILTPARWFARCVFVSLSDYKYGPNVVVPHEERKEAHARGGGCASAAAPQDPATMEY